MSEAYLPFEIQSEIIRRVLPVKSLPRFRCVSKQWRSLIDSSEFIRDHSANQAHQHNILVRYQVDSSNYKYVSIVDDDDDSFPQNKFSPVVSPTVNLVSTFAQLLDSSHGLVCLYGFINKKIMIAIWNPSIRKSVGVSVELGHRSATLGFGVCPKTYDPKIVMITPLFDIEPSPLKAEVFTLSSESWRTISMNIHLDEITQFKSEQVSIDGVIYWATYDLPYMASNMFRGDRIISFDLISEEFGEVDLPDSLARGNLCISKLNKSLVVIHFDNEDDDEFKLTRDIWMMTKNGFEKMFSVGVQTFGRCKLYGVVGFRKNGQPIRERPCGDNGSLGTSIEAYDPSTKHTCDLGIHVDSDYVHFMITSYTESLLLLNNNSYYIIQA